MTSTALKPTSYAVANIGIPARTAMAEPPVDHADVLIGKDDRGMATCSISQSSLKHIQAKARELITAAQKRVYAHFPIDRAKFLNNTISAIFTEKGICQTLTANTGINKEKHNELRNAFKSKMLSTSEGQKCGIIAARPMAKAACDSPEFKNADWHAFIEYNDVEGCSEVAKEIDDSGIPTVAYATKLSATEAQKLLDLPETAPLYTRYADDGLKVCNRSANGHDTFNIISILPGISIKFGMRAFLGNGFSSWMTLPGCTDQSGTSYASTDLMLDLGWRIFIPLKVNRDGTIEDTTFITSQVAAASTSPIPVPSSIPYQRFIGGEFAKKILLDATYNGWSIEK